MSTSVYDILARDLRERPDISFPWRPDIMAYEPAIDWAVDSAGNRSVSPMMVAAIIDRESNWRNIFQEGVERGTGCGVGLCQVTYGVDWTDMNKPKFRGVDLTVPRYNIAVAIRNFLLPALQAFPNSHQEAFDAYNLGIGGVQGEIAAGESPDTFTTGGNYGRAVMQTWITYASIGLGLQVDWSTWKPL